MQQVYAKGCLSVAWAVSMAEGGSLGESGLVRHKQKTLEMYKYILGGRNAHMTIKMWCWHNCLNLDTNHFKAIINSNFT